MYLYSNCYCFGTVSDSSMMMPRTEWRLAEQQPIKPINPINCVPLTAMENSNFTQSLGRVFNSKS